jgi:hypothetical protein
VVFPLPETAIVDSFLLAYCTPPRGTAPSFYPRTWGT